MVAVVKSFIYTGTLQEATIPAGTTSIDMYLWGGAGGGGGGDDGRRGGTDVSGRPFFDPGLGSPAQNIQFGGTGAQAGVQPVTTENLSVPDDFGFSDAERSQNIDFFNQGGLVSLLPRRATPAHSPPISYRRY